MKWFIVIGIISLAVAMYFVSDKKDVNRVMKKVRAAKAAKASERKNINTKKSAGVSQGGNQTQGKAPAQIQMKVA